MNQDEFNQAFHWPQPSIEDPRQRYYAAVNALEAKIAQTNFAGRTMLGSALGSIGFGALTIMYASKEDTVTATLCGLITLGLGAGAAYARQKGGQYFSEQLKLRIEKTTATATYLKEEDLNQPRNRKHP